MRFLTLTPLALLLVSACESKPPESAPLAAPPAGASSVNVEGASFWRLVALEGEPVEVADSLAPTLRLPPGTGKAGGFSGCNRWFAEATRAGEELRFGAIGATKMACGGDYMALEGGWLRALERTRRAVERDGGQLVLTDSTGAELATLRPH